MPISHSQEAGEKPAPGAGEGEEEGEEEDGEEEEPDPPTFLTQVRHLMQTWGCRAASCLGVRVTWRVRVSLRTSLLESQV